MEVEILIKIVIDGVATEFSYKLEDGKDEHFCGLVQEARVKLCNKMAAVIKEGCV